MNIESNGFKYELVKNYREGFDKEAFLERVTEYFDEYDYIFGDWAYGKLRLKGFNDSKNKNTTKINDIAILDDYIKNNCAYDCKYFLLKKIK
jgi:uncharacterized protein YutD